jgi:hypothetical protein
MAQTHTVPGSMTSRRKFLDKIDAAQDVPQHVKAALRPALEAVLAAHDEDRVELQRANPSLNSFKGMLRFLGHPHRPDWVAPALALSPEGYFVAVWDKAGERYAVEFLTDSTANWIAITKSADNIIRSTGFYDDFEKYETVPFSLLRISMN